jgi:hypothetical protein
MSSADAQAMGVSPQYAQEGMSLFRFYDACGPFFLPSLERLLLRHEVYLSSRKKFNDPFDVRPLLHCDWTVGEIRAHLKNIVANPSRAASSRVAMTVLNAGYNQEAALSLKKVRALKDKFPTYMGTLLDGMGICCFTEEMQNPILWVHYARRYSGVCAEFAATGDQEDPFCHIMKVHYTEQRPTIFASQTGAFATVYGDRQNWRYIAQYGICTKALEWGSEREWRWWLPYKADTYHSIPPGTLKRIYLGPLSSAQTKTQVISLARSANVPPAVYETKLSEQAFRVERGKKIGS